MKKKPGSWWTAQVVGGEHEQFHWIFTAVLSYYKEQGKNNTNTK